MDFKVTLSKIMVKKFYKELFIRNYLLIELLILIAGSTSATYYASISEWLIAIAFEVITIFLVVMIFRNNKLQMDRNIEALADSELDYDFEFLEEEVKIKSKSNTKKLNLKDLRYSKTKNFFILRLRKNSNGLFYIIPKELIGKINFNEIKNRSKKLRKENK